MLPVHLCTSCLEAQFRTTELCNGSMSVASGIGFSARVAGNVGGRAMSVRQAMSATHVDARHGRAE
jgi:hypothetical protein